jgi:mannose-6-phosphate isomerase-like protein (cupin superfamily)
MRLVLLALAAPFLPALCAADDPPPSVVGAWESIDRHVAIGSLYQPVHGVRKREGMVYVEQNGDRLTGYAIQADHAAITFQERWKDGRTDFRKVTFEGNRLMFEFDIGEWRKEAGPLAVEQGKLENKGTIRVEAVLDDDRLAGAWKMFLADGSEVFRGEWEATRAKEAPSPPETNNPQPKTETPPRPAASQEPPAKQPLVSALIRAEAAVPTRGPWGHWLRYFRGPTRDTDDMVVLAVTLKPGQEPHPPHKHIEEEFLVLTAGSGVWHLDGRESPAQVGDVVFAAPETMHGIRNTGDAPLTYYLLKWNSKAARQR